MQVNFTTVNFLSLGGAYDAVHSQLMTSLANTTSKTDTSIIYWMHVAVDNAPSSLTYYALSGTTPTLAIKRSSPLNFTRTATREGAVSVQAGVSAVTLVNMMQYVSVHIIIMKSSIVILYFSKLSCSYLFM